MTRRTLMLVMAAVTFVMTLASCGDEAREPVPFTLGICPEFVQGAVPGAATGVLVSIENETDTETPVAVTATATGAQVSVAPAEIRQGEVAEVTVIADAASTDRPLDIVVTARRGDLEQTVTRSTTVMAWEDDRREYATELLNLFTTWLADEEPSLGIDTATEFSGSFVAPGLLVVSHYLFISDEWELGLSWHVMVPPDDWAEIYLRPRAAMTPTRAFRLESQRACIDDGTCVINAVAAPVEVVR